MGFTLLLVRRRPFSGTVGTCTKCVREGDAFCLEFHCFFKCLNADIITTFPSSVSFAPEFYLFFA
jgi:hypothetical protein